MVLPQQPIQSTLQGDLHDATVRRLNGRRLVFARVVCIVIIAFTLSFFGIGLAITVMQYQSICTGLTCVLPIPEALVYFTVAGVIFWYRSNDWMAMVVALMLVLMVPISTLPAGAFDLLGSVPILQAFLYASIYLTFAAFLLFCFLFPSGRFVPRWTRWVVLIYLLWLAGMISAVLGWVNWLISDIGWNLYFIATAVALLLFIVFAQVYRYRQVSDAVERQQSKWAMAGTPLAACGWFPALFLWGPDSRVILLLIPLSLGIAILHYRLYDIEVFINRALIYGTLTGTLAAVYFGLVFGMQFLLGGLISKTNAVVLVISTLAVYALFQPLRRRIQQIIDRRFYRRKYNAAKTVEAFSATLRNEVDLAHLSEHLITIVQETMQPAHVSLWLRPSEHSRYPLRDLADRIKD